MARLVRHTYAGDGSDVQARWRMSPKFNDGSEMSGWGCLLMASPAQLAQALIDAYNAKDFAAMESMISPSLDFAHFNRNFVMSTRDELLAVLTQFASTYVPNRHFEAPERVTECGNIVVREGWYVGTAAVDLPGFGAAGEAFRLKFCSVMRFDEDGILIEWKDHG